MGFKKKTYLVILLLIAMAFFSHLVSSDLSCEITTTCNAIDLLHLSNITNAHAELPNQTFYSYKLCCNSSTYINNSCGPNSVTFLKLWNITNSHVEVSTQNNYNYNACISSDTTISCEVLNECLTNQTCLVSISNTTNAHVGNCSEYPYKICCFHNSPPVIHSIEINPRPAYTDSNLSCTVNITDIDNQELQINFSWYNGTNLYTSEIVQSYGGIITHNLTNEIQQKNENWTCKVKAFDGYQYSNELNTSIVINNSKPTKPELLTPLNDSTITNRTPLFSWSSSDKDNDTLTYEFNLTIINNICDNLPYYNSSINSNSFTPSFNLCVDSTYEWRVRAFDGEEYSDWSDIYNFTIMSWINITIVNPEMDFGTIQIGSSDDTTDNSPEPFIIVNNGNIEVNITSRAESQLWERAPLNTSFFMYKANDNESGSINLSTSITQWVNVSDTYQHLINELDWEDIHDTARVDVYVESPLDEPPGLKQANLTFIGGAS